MRQGEVPLHRWQRDSGNMTIELKRRDLLLGGSLALGGLLVPAGRALALQHQLATGFTHGVASGEPGADAMLLWTRFVAGQNDSTVSLIAEISSDPQFLRIVASGSVQTGWYRDWTAKIRLDGLDPGSSYFYRFVAPDGTTSTIGRTRTLPLGKVDRFDLAVFSCSNLPVGYFNAYAHAAQQDQLDLWFHVGDYIYEGGRSAPPRIVAPDHEAVSLMDYRARYASYRADPDLQRLHQIAPMIALWDDHESADNSWYGGANTHDPDADGDWNMRRSAAMQAYSEWMPVSDEPWQEYKIGDLATIYRTESRLLARTRHAEPGEIMSQQDPLAALKAYRDGAWSDPSGTILGSPQERWLADRLRENSRNSTWQLVGMGTNVGTVQLTEEALGWLPDNAHPLIVDTFRLASMATGLGMASLFDNWGGYPAARSRFLRSSLEADANLVMLSGDSHNAWAFDLVEGGQAAGVDFGGHSVTSNGLELVFRGDPKAIARRIVASSPELRWADTSQRGYMAFEISAEAVTGEWRFLQTISERSTALANRYRMNVQAGHRRFSR